MPQVEDNIWPKRITVDKRIVSILSQSTYDNFPRALKELITNSYDADAKSVSIKVDLKNETITIHDTGRGMNAGDFEFYLRIAGKTRKKEDNKTPLGRNIIGQFGVGFLAVFPFFKNYQIETKKSGSPAVLHANIPLSKYFLEDRRLVEIGSILIDGGTKQDPSKTSLSYTTIILKGFNDLTKAFFFAQPKNKKGKIDKNEVDTFEGIDKLKWILSDDLPLKFSDEKFNKIFHDDEPISFEVTVNDEPLYRKMYGTTVLETHKGDYKQIGKIKLRYCIVTPGRSVKPYEARFLKVRNLNVGVGDEREHFGTAHGATRSRLHWLSGEIHILEGMNELIKISRDGFNFSPDFEEMKSFFNSRLNYFSNRLEDEAEISREIKQTGKQFRVSDISLLNKETINRKLAKFEDEGFSVKQSASPSSKISISRETKEIQLPSELANFEKHIFIKNKKYKVISQAWDFKTDTFPACKLDGKTIILNSNYPLFKGKKYTDIFVKLHLMLVINYSDKIISAAAFKTLSNEVLEYYSDYKN